MNSKDPHSNQNMNANAIANANNLFARANALTRSSIEINQTKPFDALLNECNDCILKSSSDNERSLLQSLSRKIEILKNNNAVIDNVLIEQFPDPTEPLNSSTQMTIGDLHGNALKFIYFLIHQNVLILKNSQADYEILVTLYEKSKINSGFNEEDLQQFREILKEASITSQKNITIRLIGDEMGDRGNNDFLTLLLLEKLNNPNIVLEILLSNHGMEFLEYYENDFQNPGGNLGIEQASSLFGLDDLLKRKLITKEEVTNLIKNHYLPNLKLVSYSIDNISIPANITIYTHAPVGIKTIEALAQKFNINFKKTTIEAFAKTIDQINDHFSTIKENKAISATFNQEMGTEYRPVETASFQSPFIRITWNRISFDFAMNDPRPNAVNNNYTISYVHGHDGIGKVPKEMQSYIRNLDNNLGKYPYSLNLMSNKLYYIQYHFTIIE